MTTWPRALAVMGLTLLATSACASQSQGDVTTDDARAVTTEEAQALAMTRLRNLEAGTRTVAFEVNDQGTHLEFDGWFDYASGTGYGLLSEDEGGNLILWNHTAIAATTWADASEEVPAPPSADSLDESWNSSPLDSASSRLHSVLAVVAALVSDRPENPLLVQGAGALWLAERSRDDVDLLVIAGPPSEEALAPGEVADPDAATIRYWIESTGTAHQVDVLLGAGGVWTEVVFGPAEGVTIEDPSRTAEGSP